MKNYKLISIETRMATEDDEHLPAYDHTTLSNINVCPTWGVIRYIKHLKMPSSHRQMALEAGSAAHEGFAAVKWYQFYSRQVSNKCEANIAERHGLRLFGEERFGEMRDTLSNTATDRTNLVNFAILAIESSGFYDDISDNRRTMSNICESFIAYIDRYDLDRYPIWVRDKEDASSDIGIEIPFNIVVTITYEFQEGNSNGATIRATHCSRFTGKLDGLHINKDHLMVREEKTGARLDDAWLSQWILSHQVTGYCVAASTFTNLECLDAMVSGMRIPIGNNPGEGIRIEKVTRNLEMIEKWTEWFVYTADVAETYRDDPLSAPMFTHSCNRYFSSCSFMPLCAGVDRNDKEAVMNQMEYDRWSPLDE